jgi:broad specificity phosphatase PhoE
MLTVILVRPGATSFDDDGRIKGTLELPLSDCGMGQAEKTAVELAEMPIECLYVAPCMSAQQTANVLNERCGWKVKTIDCFKNLDQGLWQGKRIEEVRRQLPKVYRQYQENPGTVCPPGGETLDTAEDRAKKGLTRLLKKHRQGVIGMVVPEPMASVVKHLLCSAQVGDLWKSCCDDGHWDSIQLSQGQLVLA